MALSATIYTFTIHLSDSDRSVYETLDLRVARHPSETMAYMVTRVLAYCLEYGPGLTLTEGVSSGDEPAIVERDLTGRVTAWIEVGMPDAARLHRGSKLAGRAAVYTHRDVSQLLAQFEGERIHNAAALPIYALDRAFVDELAAAIDRRNEMSISVTDRELYVSTGERQFTSKVTERRIVPAN
jgi:uncharacterized protein YaeQ